MYKVKITDVDKYGSMVAISKKTYHNKAEAQVRAKRELIKAKRDLVKLEREEGHKMSNRYYASVIKVISNKPPFTSGPPPYPREGFFWL